ncbi:MAG: DNA methyltransferase [Candidatus Cloacimonetes bacterium]|nr:DNA methyltransferase [Candidatus Cloacimonadota bacterium]
MIDILEKLLKKALKNVESGKKTHYHNAIIDNIDVLIDNIDKNKSLISVTVTSLLKKIIDPEQDIRLHRTDFVGGYSARTLDTNATTPFFKKYFPKYANKESGFLSMVTRASIPWTLENSDKIRTRASKQLLASFLTIFDSIEKKVISPEKTLIYFFEKLTLLSRQQKNIYDDVTKSIDVIGILNINRILSMLEKHFAMKLSSRLPVIAIYTIYQHLLKQIKRYKNKVLLPLNVHTSADKHGYGDIEIRFRDNNPYEIVEIKHNISIDRFLVFDILKKSQNTSIERYYILTTAQDNFVSVEEEEYISNFVLRIKKEFNIEIIVNGIFNSLKYYLRFIDDYEDFIKSYTMNLIQDSKISTEIKEYHIIEWQNILKDNKILIWE